MMSFTKWITIVWAVCFLSGCTSFSEERSVIQILNNKERYQGRELLVSGVIVITPKRLAVCESEAPEDCLNLEVRREIFDELKANDGAVVSVKGTYSDHEFKNIDGESIFYPSRLVVSEIIK